MYRYLLDSSAICAYLVPDEDTEEINLLFEQFYDGKAIFFVLDLTVYEVINTLKSMYIAKRLSFEELVVFSEELQKLELIVIKLDFNSALKLSLDYSLSFYDSSYFSAALQNHLNLISLDSKLMKAYKQESGK